ncbi:MAG: acyl-CoA dehydrogenase, partial [Actinomycetota bacterium]|nr:acyl-CoA dehydrogenase [Actinomycetota bacterium]
MGTEDLPGQMTAEARELLRDMKAIASEKLAPIAAAGTPGRLNRPLIAALAEHGVLPRIFPEELDGTGTGEASAAVLCLLREGLAQGSTEAETALALQGLGAYPILQAGREELRRRWLPRVAQGEAVAAFALTEPEAGSDAGRLTLNAERTDGGYVLTGQKKWISNAPD